MWKNVCGNFDQFQELNSKHFETVNFKNSTYSGYRHRELTKEINEWIFLNPNFLTRKNYHLYKNQLDDQLIDFTKLSAIKKYYTMTKNFLNEEIPNDDQLLHPVYVTLLERVEHNNTTRKTKESL